jgi:hypothetical protein
MADFYYETYISVRGPWLLDMSQLSDLDSAILQQWERLEAYREQIIDQEVQSKLPDAIESAYPKPEKRKEKDAVRDELRKRVATTYTNSKNELTVTLHLRGGKKLVASTIKEAIEHAGVADTEVMELTVEIEVVEVRAKLIIDMKDNSVACRVLPESLTESRELFAVFRDWIEKHRPKRWLCICSETNPLRPTRLMVLIS